MARDCDLVQRIQGVQQKLTLTQEIAKLSKIDLVIFDEMIYFCKENVESSTLFEPVAARYECPSIAVTANRSFGQWHAIFPEPAMTTAAIDRLAHHAPLFELNVENYLCR